MAVTKKFLTPAKIEGQEALKAYLSVLVETKAIPHVISEPGDGKTSLISSLFFTEHNHSVNILGNSEPQDIQGFPHIVEEKYTNYASQKWVYDAINYQNTPYFQDYPYFYVFFDELAQARADVQQSLLTPLESRILPSGDKLPDYVRFICASNPPEYSPRGNTLIPALANRMSHVKFIPLIDEWIPGFLDNWGQPLSETGKNLREKIATFARDNKSSMRTLEPSTDYAFPSLRAYTKLAEALEPIFERKIPNIDLSTFISSFVGLDAASKLVRYLEDSSIAYANFFSNYRTYSPGDKIIVDTNYMNCLLADKDAKPEHVAKRMEHLYNGSHAHFRDSYREKVKKWASDHKMSAHFDKTGLVELW